MKTKYKILIISIMVLSILACFMITSFAAYTTTDITYNNNTYEYDNNLINMAPHITNYDKIEYYDTYQELRTIDYENDDDIALSLTLDHGIVMFEITKNGQYLYSFPIDNNNSINLYVYGDFSMYSDYDGGTTLNVPNELYYSIFQNSNASSNNVQINIVHAVDNDPLKKVDSFLTYLSASITKITTMIIANQILILFIVAVPVVSFVIGSFKRIKDSGRV